MQLFELVSPRLFRPLAGPNRAFYAELLLLLWEECRRTVPSGKTGGVRSFCFRKSNIATSWGMMDRTARCIILTIPDRPSSMRG